MDNREKKAHLMLYPDRPPRNAESSQAPGSYRIIVRTKSAVVDRGEDLAVSVFFSGYGEIAESKLIFFPSPGVFSSEESTARHSFGQFPDGSYGMGINKEVGIDDAGFAMNFSGVQSADWKRSTLFFDTNEGLVPTLATEKIAPHAPLEVNLRIKKDARPGPYTISFCFTYFDSKTWQSEVVTIPFTVRTVWQRREGHIATVAYIAAVATVVGAIAAVVALRSDIASALSAIGAFIHHG
jgi:hypothetical protein